MLSDDLANRLYNWKFASAKALLDGSEQQWEGDGVRALAASFANVGWFDGPLAEVIGLAVRALINDVEYEDDLISVVARHRQEHQPDTGDSRCACEEWTGPFTMTTEARSFAAHIVEVVKEHERATRAT